MPRYAIAFVLPSRTNQLRHRIVESADRDSALRSFFNEQTGDSYSNDDQGFFYFKEDFFDESNPSGSVLALD